MVPDENKNVRALDPFGWDFSSLDPYTLPDDLAERVRTLFGAGNPTLDTSGAREVSLEKAGEYFTEVFGIDGRNYENDMPRPALILFDGLTTIHAKSSFVEGFYFEKNGLVISRDPHWERYSFQQRVTITDVFENLADGGKSLIDLKPNLWTVEETHFYPLGRSERGIVSSSDIRGVKGDVLKISFESQKHHPGDYPLLEITTHPDTHVVLVPYFPIKYSGEQ